MKEHIKEIRDIFVSIAVIAAAVVGIMVWTDMHGCGDVTEAAQDSAERILQTERALNEKLLTVCVGGHQFYCLSFDDQPACLPFGRVLTDNGVPVQCKVGVAVTSRK